MAVYLGMSDWQRPAYPVEMPAGPICARWQRVLLGWRDPGGAGSSSVCTCWTPFFCVRASSHLSLVIHPTFNSRGFPLGARHAWSVYLVPLVIARVEGVFLPTGRTNRKILT